MTGRTGATGIDGLVDRLFRREAGRMVAALTRTFGPARLDLAEEVVQEAMLRACRLWPFRGVPRQPVGWLYRVARNCAIDRLRHDRTIRERAVDLEPILQPPAAAGAARFPDEITDDQLRLVFLCCHPDLPHDGRVALTLKTVCGFHVDEIARAFLVRRTTIEQRLLRVRRRLRGGALPFEMPEPREVPDRLDSVLQVLYLLFNEGYAAYEGTALIRSELCDEALRLADRLAAHPVCGRPEAHALCALLLFQSSRQPARLDRDGELVLLSDQDRSRWDWRRITRAFHHLERAATGSRETDFHLEAAIAAHHAAAGDDPSTDWAAILALYDRLIDRNPSPVVALNRAVALARVDGPRAGLQALDGIETMTGHAALDGYYLFPATRGDLLFRDGDYRAAAAAFDRALACRCSGPERRFLQRRRHQVSGQGGRREGVIRLDRVDADRSGGD